MRQILFTLTRMMAETYSVNTTWRFADQSQQLLINGTLASSFEKILWYVYGIDDRENLDEKITGVFSVSAQYLFTVLRPSQAEDFPLHPILNSIFAVLESPITVSNATLFTLRVRQTRATLRLSERLLQVGKYLNMPLSPFETQLFGAVPLLVRLYIALDEYKLPVTRVLSLLVSHASEDHSAEPPSLFGSLGAEATCRFLDCLSQFDRPFDDFALRSRQWSFLSEIISSRQQWIAVFLLTGASPRHDLHVADTDKKPAASPHMLGKAFMVTALDILTAIDTLPPATVLSALEFVAKAQEHWPWVTPELAKRDGLFTKILKYVTSIKPQNPDIQQRCYDIRIAASVADICSMYSYSAKEARDINFFKTLRPAISWYSRNAIEVNGYNASLHSNLNKNFEMKYPHFKLTDIKRTVLESHSLNGSSFYDLELADQLFSKDFAWSGSPKGSLIQEVERANFNLLLVDSQKKLLQSFKFLAIEHCASFIQDREIQRAMAKVVRQCLASNASTSSDEAIFAPLHQSRADFALALLQRLVEVNARGSEVFQLLNMAWETIRVRHQTYESALTSDDKSYFTTLLEVLYLSLQFHTEVSKRGSPEGVSKKPDLSSDLSTVVEIFKIIVVDGFRALTTHLHEESQSCSPRDFALLNAIFESILQVKDVSHVLDQISFSLLEGDMPRYAVTLFSWATKFTINNDPIYGELSLLFLLQMSSIPAVAGQLAVDNVFMKLSTCQLTKLLCASCGCGPFDQIPRFFAIWSGGILPLCLSVLFHTNEAAPEIVTFLNQFDSQLNRSADSLALSKGTSLLATKSDEAASLSERISLGMVCEVSHLALLTCIIRRMRAAGAAIAFDSNHLDDLKWDKALVKMDIESLLEKRSLLRTRITPTNEKESRLLRRKAIDPNSGCQNALEERVVKELRNTLMCLSDAENLAN
ncbi:hypothetical protein KEM54_000124 [Ascosphaera aggregata]|nr:hypothetical protein KEM54_000124 [Ascosphaera aggregata]